MAGPAKKRNVEAQGAQQGHQQVPQEQIQVDFEGRNPEPDDFHGIKQLLQQLFLKAHIDLTQISDLLIAQNGIGSVLKQSSDDDDVLDEEEDDNLTDCLDVFGITSVLNISANKDLPSVQQLTALLLDLAQKHSSAVTLTAVKNALSNCKVGLLINERFVNIPAKISDPLLSSLQQEIERKAKKDDSYKFDYYVVICKLHKPKSDQGEVIFSNAEEEVFDSSASCKFEFDVSAESDTSVAGKWTGEAEMVPHRRVLLIEASKLPEIISNVKQLVA